MNGRRAFYIVPALSVVILLATVIPPQIFSQTKKGIELYTSWQLKEAEKVLRDALKADPRDVAANFYLGLTILMEDKHSEALDMFLKVKGDMGKAGRRTQPAIPDEYQIQMALARAHLELKQYAEAWQNLESADKAHPRDSDVHVYRGVYYLRQEKLQEAIKELEEAMHLDEHNAYAHYYAGHAYLRSGNPARAVEMFKTFLNLAPLAPEATRAKALVDALC